MNNYLDMHWENLWYHNLELRQALIMECQVGIFLENFRYLKCESHQFQMVEVKQAPQMAVEVVMDIAVKVVIFKLLYIRKLKPSCIGSGHSTNLMVLFQSFLSYKYYKVISYYLLEGTNNKVKEVLCRGIYKEYEFLVFKGKIAISEIRIWRDKFQEKVYEIVGKDCLEFTCVAWNLGWRP